jgi:hypothetical protein
MVGGLTLQAAGMAWLALIVEPGVAYSQMLAPFIVAGVGISMAIPSAQNSVVGSVSMEAIGKAAGTNSMMRELGGVFGIAVAVAVFAGAGSYASVQAFTDGFGPAIFVASGLALAGAISGLALPGRRGATKPEATPAIPVAAIPRTRGRGWELRGGTPSNPPLPTAELDGHAGTEGGARDESRAPPRCAMSRDDGARGPGE